MLPALITKASVLIECGELTLAIIWTHTFALILGFVAFIEKGVARS